MHNSFAIMRKLLEVMILVLRPNTDCCSILGLKYESILKELYITLAVLKIPFTPTLY